MRLEIAILSLIFSVSAATAQPPVADDDIASRIISIPAPSAFRLDGTLARGNVRRDPEVQGGRALRVQVPGRSERAWSVTVAVPITGAVRAGDALVLAFWARLERGENEASSSELPYNAVQMAGAPYTPVFAGAASIGPEWQMHEFRGRADRDYAAGELNVAIHLATARQTVDIGPVFVLNMGQTAR